ncbi:hypothetical protein [Halalkalibacter okhensis]|uniref:hypothetical protein n=1 Tax=Halalkalibacter okhensis TaxID=333138 RepID=UPI0012698E08|nr:hypothetical protein [Halalkalibacter okhensis]
MRNKKICNITAHHTWCAVFLLFFLKLLTSEVKKTGPFCKIYGVDNTRYSNYQQNSNKNEQIRLTFSDKTIVLLRDKVTSRGWPTPNKFSRNS